MPCLLRRSQSPISMNCAATVPVLVQALSKSKRSFDPATADEVRRNRNSALFKTQTMEFARLLSMR